MAILSSAEDAFGEALRDHLEGRTAHQLLLEEADGRVRPAMAPAEFFTPYEAWPQWEQFLIDAARGPVLDLGCGAGRHGLHLQACGHNVTGIDNSPGAVAVSRALGVRDVRLADLLDPPADRAWGTVLLMCGNLGLAGDREQTVGLLSRLGAIVSPDGVVIGDTVDPTFYGASDDSPARLRLRYGNLLTPWWFLYNIPQQEINNVVEASGWYVAELVGDPGSYGVVLRQA